MFITVNNPTETKEISSLSARAEAGAATITVLNTNGVSDDDFVVVGKLGEEQSEIRSVDSVSGAGSLNLATALSLAHPVGSEVYVIQYNQIEISYKQTENGSFSVLTTVNIEADSLDTTYDHVGGQTTFFYRIRFYNSNTGQYSSYSNTMKGTGPSTSEASTMVDSVLSRTNDEKGEFTTRKEALKDLNFAAQKVTNALNQASSEYNQSRIEIATEDFKHEYTLPDDFKEIVEIRDANGEIIEPTPHSDTSLSRGYELVGLRTLYLEDVPQPLADSDEAPTEIVANNAYDENGTWVASLDATNVTTDLDEFKTGVGSVNFDLDVSADAGNVAAMTNSSFTSLDLEDFEDTGRIRFWLYIPDVTYTTSVTLRWGSSASDYWSLALTKTYKNETFRDGWNLIEVEWGDSDVTETGTPLSTAVDYLQVRIAYGANQADDTDYRLGSFLIANAWNSNSVYELTYLHQPTQVKNENDEFQIPEGYQYLLLDYAVGQAFLRQEGKMTLGREMLANFNKEISKFITQAAKRTRRTIGFSHGHKRGYSYSRR